MEKIYNNRVIEKVNMQAIKQKSSSKKRLCIALLLAVVIAGSVAAYAYSQKLGPFTESKTEEAAVEYSEPSSDQVVSGQDIKKGTINASKPTDGSSGADTPTSSTTNSTVTVEITNDPKNNNGNVTIKVMAQEVTSSGVCTITLIKPGQTSVAKTGKAQPLPSSSACQLQFDVSKLAKGSWTINVNYKSDKSNGATSGSVTV